MRRRSVPALALLCAACSAEAGPGPATQAAGCSIVQPSRPLGGRLEESSGVAVSRAHPGVLWSHGDSGTEAAVVAIHPTGESLGTTRVAGAVNVDWEDLAVGPCPGGSCLYLADTGDNERRRGDAALYRAPEPTPGAASVTAERFPVRYPGGRPDTEALFVLPDGEIFLVTKGRDDPQVVYRYPLPLRAGQRVLLEEVATLERAPSEVAQQITAASASPSGEWVAIREYKRLAIHRAADLLAGRVAPALEIDLTPVGEAQGEGVALLDNGRVVLTSEGAFAAAPGSIAVLQCELPS